MNKSEKALLNTIIDFTLFIMLSFSMFYAKDLMQAVKWGFMLVAMTIINKK